MYISYKALDGFAFYKGVVLGISYKALYDFPLIKW